MLSTYISIQYVISIIISVSLGIYIVIVTVKSLSLVRLFATPWTRVYQAPLSMGFSRQEYWNGLPFLNLYTIVLKSNLRVLGTLGKTENSLYKEDKLE